MAFVIVALILFAVLQAAVRFAPMVSDVWHIDPFKAEDPKDAGVLEIVETDLSDVEVMARIAQIADDTARTTRVAGKVNNTWQTYQTRTLLWGFPDYTTVKTRKTQTGTQVAFLARLRFGRKDFGVNGRRVAAWIKAADL